jgi:hypothetical protein
VQNRVPESGAPPKKPFVMLPEEIATQIFLLATNARGRRISHPAFTLLNYLETLAPEMVDRVLKRIL